MAYWEQGVGGPGAFGGQGGMNIQALMQMLSGGMDQYQQFLQNPTASPLYQNQLHGLLAAMRPGEKLQRQNLGDVFRGAGNMSSGIYGNAASNLIGQQGLNEQTMASQLLGQTFPQMTQAMMGPMGIYSNLLQTLMQKQPGQPGAGGGQPGATPEMGQSGYDPWGFSIGPYPSHT